MEETVHQSPDIELMVHPATRRPTVVTEVKAVIVSVQRSGDVTPSSLSLDITELGIQKLASILSKGKFHSEIFSH